MGVPCSEIATACLWDPWPNAGTAQRKIHARIVETLFIVPHVRRSGGGCDRRRVARGAMPRFERCCAGCSSTVLIFRDFREHFCRVVGIRAAVPKPKTAAKITGGLAQFVCEDSTPDFKASIGCAERAQKFSVEAVLARDLSHHLHQAPGDRAR